MADQTGAELRTQLGRVVAARRVALGLSVARAAEMAEINRRTWSRVEDGSNDPEDFTYGRVERTLRWRPGSIQRWIDAGAEPEAVDEPAPAERAALVINDPDLLRYVTIMNDPAVPVTQRQFMRQQLRLWADQIESQLEAVRPRRVG
jgi:hypothetical protein